MPYISYKVCILFLQKILFKHRCAFFSIFSSLLQLIFITFITQSTRFSPVFLLLFSHLPSDFAHRDADPHPFFFFIFLCFYLNENLSSLFLCSSLRSASQNLQPRLFPYNSTFSPLVFSPAFFFITVSVFFFLFPPEFPFSLFSFNKRKYFGRGLSLKKRFATHSLCFSVNFTVFLFLFFFFQKPMPIRIHFLFWTSLLFFPLFLYLPCTRGDMPEVRKLRRAACR